MFRSRYLCRLVTAVAAGRFAAGPPPHPVKNFVVRFVCFVAFCAAASAQTVLFTITLNGSNAGTGSSGTGSGTATLNTSTHTLTLSNITFSGLSGTSTAAHIHGPLPGTGILYDLGSYFTTGSTSGTINGSFNFVNGTSGYSIAQQEAQLQSNQWYINIHSTSAGGGEIAGTLTAVPEPATVAMWMGVAGFALGGLWRRRSAPAA